MTELQTDGLRCNIYRNSSDKICYILSPMPPDDKVMTDMAARCGCSIAVIYGMDWDNDLTPWTAPGEPPGCPPFRGDAPAFMKYLCGSVVPEVEGYLGINTGNINRTLIGVSLSGLFALWCWMQNDVFKDMASISGSFWYRGFVDWLKEYPTGEKSGRVYISLGDREAHTPVKAFRSVAADTDSVCRILAGKGIDVTFQQTKGTHFAPLCPRLRRAMYFLYHVDDL